jgi:hypothetical protein
MFGQSTELLTSLEEEVTFILDNVCKSNPDFHK